MSDVRVGEQPAKPALAAPIQVEERRTGGIGMRRNSFSEPGPGPGPGPATPSQSQPRSAANAPTPDNASRAAQFHPAPSPEYGAPTAYNFSLTDDTDDTAVELEEFYSYVEAPLLIENHAAWHEWCAAHGFDVHWTTLPQPSRRKILLHLLSQLDLRDASARISASRALLYLLQGSFSETSSAAEQLHWICENAHTVLTLGGVEDIYLACKRACAKHDWASKLPDYVDLSGNASSAENGAAAMTPDGKAELIEEINVEISVYFAQLYAILETQRGDLLRDTLMALDPPLPVFTIELTASLREKSIRGFPIKKLILILWKSILGSLGGFDDIARCKQSTRIREGLPLADKSTLRVASRPEDLHHVLEDISLKYPTLTHPHLAEEGQRAEVLSSATAVLSDTPGNGHSMNMSHIPDPLGQEVGFPGGTFASAPQPPGPKAGKQKFQTDQSRPFVFPYSNRAGNGAAPFSVYEALSLYQKHMYIPTSLWQQWCVRQDYIRHEGASDEKNNKLAQLRVIGGTAPPSDAERLEWVEQIYSGTLPYLQSAVIVLLKLALATMTSGHTNSAYSRALAEGLPLEDAPEPTLEDIDVTRHREILNKAISATLFLLLKWFRASHTMKFEYLSQIMLDSNILLLVLKFFGLQEVSHMVRWRSEVPEFGLFGYAQRLGADGNTAPQDVLNDTELRTGDVWGARDPNGYSFRNLFAVSNLTRILQRLTKDKTHRILLMVQYKSTAILKRSLKVPHTGFQRYVLKLMKSQVPFCGRKWRQSNMRIITLIYLHCRPGLRDDWLVGGDMDAEVEASLPEEQSLRRLVRHYNLSVFPPKSVPHNAEIDDSSASTYPYYTVRHAESEQQAEMPADEAAAFERDAFPLAARSGKHAAPGRYIFDDSIEGFLDVYEDELNELFTNPTSLDLVDENGEPTDWSSRVNKLIGAPDNPTEDSASEISSIISTPSSETPAADVPARPGTAPPRDDNRNYWEHLSPREMRYLSTGERGPNGRLSRSVSTEWIRSSRFDRRVNSSPLERPLLHWNMEDLVEDAISVESRKPYDQEDAIDVPNEPLPSPKPGGIDEVEHIFGA